MAKKREQSVYRIVSIIPELSVEERKRRARKTIETILSVIKENKEKKMIKDKDK